MYDWSERGKKRAFLDVRFRTMSRRAPSSNSASRGNLEFSDVDRFDRYTYSQMLVRLSVVLLCIRKSPSITKRGRPSKSLSSELRRPAFAPHLTRHMKSLSSLCTHEVILSRSRYPKRCRSILQPFANCRVAPTSQASPWLVLRVVSIAHVLEFVLANIGD
jgi:hypothetical protein